MNKQLPGRSKNSPPKSRSKKSANRRAASVAGKPRVSPLTRNSLESSTPPTAATSSRAARLFHQLLVLLMRLAKPFVQERGSLRNLQLLEIQQLGEKRFVGIVRVGNQKFLIGGAASSVTLLAVVGADKTRVITPRRLNQESA